MDIIPIFKTSGSIGKSLITVEDELEIKENAPVSIFAIASQNKLDKLIVIDDTFVNFPSLYKLSNKYNIQLIFGVNFTICNDKNKKDEESLFSNCKVSVLMKNSGGYKDLIKLNNQINANPETFYYEGRGHYSDLLELITDNLLLVIPPHNNFLEKNLIFNGTCLPNWGNLRPIFTYCDRIELPYTQIVNPKIKEYARNNNYELQEVWPIYYYKKEDYKSYNILRAINNRSKFNMPDIEYLSNDNFCWESYKNYADKNS